MKMVWIKLIKMKNVAPFEITERKAVIFTGAPSYTSAVHKWKGTAEILKPKPAIIKMMASNCNSLPLISFDNSFKFKVPVLPYSMEMPNNMIPEAKAEERIIFIPASDERGFS